MTYKDCPSVEYLCLESELAAEACETHPFFDRPSWQDGYGRGYQDGRQDGERLGVRGVRTELVEHLRVMAGDLRLGLRHDLETPLAVVQGMTQLVQSHACGGRP